MATKHEPHAVTVHTDPADGGVQDHDYQPVAGHPDDNECTHRADGTDKTYCGRPDYEHEVDITQITFTCTAPPDAFCRTYCTENCDTWGCDHLLFTGQDCYAHAWFQIGPEGTTYGGADAEDFLPPAIPKSGLINIVTCNHDDGLIWEWAR